MKDKDLKRWEKYRKKGKEKTVLEKGVVQFGLGVAILNTITFHILHPEASWHFTFIYNLIICPVTGIFLVLWTWHRLEKQYNKEIGKHQSTLKKENQA